MDQNINITIYRLGFRVTTSLGGPDKSSVSIADSQLKLLEQLQPLGDYESDSMIHQIIMIRSYPRRYLSLRCVPQV